MKAILAILLLAILSPIPSYADEPSIGISVEKAWARKTRRTMSAAAYMTIHNNGDSDQLLGVKAGNAAHTTLHRSYEEDGIMKMDHVGVVQINQGSVLKLEPGSYHIMLMQLDAPLKKGTTFPVVLTFEKAGDITVDVQVTGMAGLQ